MFLFWFPIYSAISVICLSPSSRCVCVCVCVWECISVCGGASQLLLLFRRQKSAFPECTFVIWVRVWSLAVPWKFSSAFLSCICFGGVFYSISTSSQMCITRPCACVCVCAVLWMYYKLLMLWGLRVCMHTLCEWVSECLCAWTWAWLDGCGSNAKE